MLLYAHEIHGKFCHWEFFVESFLLRVNGFYRSGGNTLTPLCLCAVCNAQLSSLSPIIKTPRRKNLEHIQKKIGLPPAAIEFADGILNSDYSYIF